MRTLTLIAALVASLGSGCAGQEGRAEARGDAVAAVSSGDPWSRVRPGASYVQRAVMVTRAPMNPHESEARYRTRVIAISETTVTLGVTVEGLRGLLGAGGAEERHERPRGPFTPPPAPEESRDTTVEVPAGTFPCRYVRDRARDGMGEWVTEVWYDPALPVPYKVKIEGPRSTTIELESFDLD